MDWRRQPVLDCLGSGATVSKGTLDSVRAFMGEDYETAHVPGQAQAVLADFDRRSAHYEVLDRRDQPA